MPVSGTIFRENLRKPPLEVLLGAVVAAGTVARFLTALQYPPTSALWSDPGRHWLYGQNPLLESPLAAIDPIGYQIWLAAVYRVVLQDPLANGVYAGLLSSVTPWLWYRFFRELVPSRRLALAGWALLAVLPSWVGIYSYFMTETLFLPALGLALWLTWAALRERDGPSLVKATLAWTSASLTRAMAVPLAAIALVHLVWRAPNRQRALATTSAIVIACCLPAAYRSYRCLGVWAPFGYPTLNRIYMVSGCHTIEFDAYKNGKTLHYTYGFTSPALAEAPLAPLSQWKSTRKGTLRFVVDLDYGARDWHEALRKHRAPFSAQMRWVAENWVYLLFGRSWPDCNPARPWEKLAIHTRWFWAPMLLLVLAADLRYLVRHRRLPLLPLLTLTSWLLVAILPLAPVEGRYRKPLEGLLVANALWAIAWTRQRREDAGARQEREQNDAQKPAVSRLAGTSEGTVEWQSGKIPLAGEG